jgi:hypothetical protein
MAEDGPRHPSERALEQGHEPRDVRPGRIALIGAGIMAMIVLLALVPWAMVGLFDDWAPRRPVTAVELMEVPAPEPRLDATPGGTLAEELARQRRLLGEYAWVDPAAGIARIPIEQAMLILAERGEWPEPDGGTGVRLRGPAYLPSEAPYRGAATQPRSAAPGAGSAEREDGNPGTGR